MKCANCSNEAVYTVTYNSARPVNYCEACLPKHLRQQAFSGEFPLQTKEEPRPAASKPAPKPRKKEKNEDLPGTSEASASDPVESDDAEGPVS